MTPKQLSGVQGRLDEFLETLVEPIGRSERRHWAGVYVQGLLLDGARKSVQPMAASIDGADEQALNQFLNQSPWAVAEMQRRLAHRLSDQGHEPVSWMIDETSLPKAGEHSVGATRQYGGALGKIANCQVAVSLHWRQAQLSYPMSWRLYLPKEWCEDRDRRTQARIPAAVIYQTKTNLALELVDQAITWDVPRGAVVADSFYGNDFSFRAALREKQLDYGGRKSIRRGRASGSSSNGPRPPLRRRITGCCGGRTAMQLLRCYRRCAPPEAAGRSSRITANSKKNSASITSRAAAGPAGIITSRS